jgi:hypothetical protein
MSLFSVAISNALIADPVTQLAGVRAFFTKIDQVTIDWDSARDFVYGGPGYLPILSISKDQKPMVNLSGPEFPAQAIPHIIGGTGTKAAVGTPLQQAWIDQRTIGSDGNLNVPLSFPISATNLNLSIITDLDFQKFTPAATTPTTGQYVTPVGGTSQLTFSTTDAGKIITISYYFDNTTGSKMGVGATSQPKTHLFVATGYWVNSADPNKEPFEATIQVAQCQFADKFTFGGERNKVTSTKMPLTILDPGGAQDAVQLTAVKPFV